MCLCKDALEMTHRTGGIQHASIMHCPSPAVAQSFHAPTSPHLSLGGILGFSSGGRGLMGGLDGSGGAGRLRPGGSNSGVDGPLRGAVCRQQHIASGHAKASPGGQQGGRRFPAWCSLQAPTFLVRPCKAWRRANCRQPHILALCAAGLCAGQSAATHSCSARPCSNSEGDSREQSACMRSCTCPRSGRLGPRHRQHSLQVHKLGLTGHAVTWNGPDGYNLHHAQLSGRLHGVQCRLARVDQDQS